jgi:hypothetical protein
MQVQNLARRLGATPAAKTVVYLRDGTPVNFVYEVTGLGAFAQELAKYILLQFHCAGSIRVLEAPAGKGHCSISRSKRLTIS